jgi:hypothetical protein
MIVLIRGGLCVFRKVAALDVPKLEHIDSVTEVDCVIGSTVEGGRAVSYRGIESYLR